jgi:hypothetical protein
MELSETKFGSSGRIRTSDPSVNSTLANGVGIGVNGVGFEKTSPVAPSAAFLYLDSQKQGNCSSTLANQAAVNTFLAIILLGTMHQREGRADGKDLIGSELGAVSSGA